MPIQQKFLANFEDGCFYHIYNRSISNRLVFREEKNYYYFLQLLKQYIAPCVDIYAYALIPNHFHLFTRIPQNKYLETHKSISNQFRSLFIAYTNAINKLYGERGGLFQTPFRRIKIDRDSHFTQLIYYIHYNAVHHNLSVDMAGYKWSSYQSLLSDSTTLLKRKDVLEWFGGKELFSKYHMMQKPEFVNDILIHG